MPITSFAPELLEIFKKAAIEQLTIPLKNDKAAIRLRHRMNRLRKALREAHHPIAEIANAVQFQITKDGDLIACPVDLEFIAALKLVGINIGALPPASTSIDAINKAVRAEPTAPEMSAIFQFLQEGDKPNE